MKKSLYDALLLLMLPLSLWACNGTTAPATEAMALPTDSAAEDPAEVTSDSTRNGTWISEFIRRIFPDRDGNLWLGTERDGVVRYDGRHLDYFSPVEGFSGTSVRGMVQDAQGDIWFATRGGVARFDGRGFTKYTSTDGLADDQVWCVLLATDGTLWFGTEGGVSRYDGHRFTPFALPVPAPDARYHSSKHPDPRLVNTIIQDRTGAIWFGTNGGGAYRYDGRAFSTLTEKDGLANNFVQSMLEDRAGNLWFGTRFGGLSKYDGERFTNFTRKDGLNGDLIWTLYEDRAGAIWMSTTYAGACRYDGSTFTCFQQHEGLGSSSVHSIMEDAQGQLWFGTSAGLYRFDGARFHHFSKEEAVEGRY